MARTIESESLYIVINFNTMYHMPYAILLDIVWLIDHNGKALVDHSIVAENNHYIHFKLNFELLRDDCWGFPDLPTTTTTTVTSIYEWRVLKCCIFCSVYCSSTAVILESVLPNEIKKKINFYFS